MAHSKSKYLYPLILTALIILVAGSAGCSSEDNSNLPSSGQVASANNLFQASSDVTDSLVTAGDIDEGIEFVQNYLNAYKEGDMDKLRDLYFPNRYPERTNEYFKSKKNLTIKRVSYPTVYLKGYVEDTYKSRHKEGLYKGLILFAEYEENGEHTENDFILIKLKPDSKWLLYDMGK